MLRGRRVVANELGRFRLRIRKLIRLPRLQRERDKGPKDSGANGGFWRDPLQATGSSSRRYRARGKETAG